MRSEVGLSRQIAGEEPRNGSPDLFRVPCLIHTRKRGTKSRRRTPNGTSAATAGRHACPRTTYFGLPKKSLVPGPDFDITPRNLDTNQGGNRGDSDSAEEPGPSCSSEGLVTPLLGTQSLLQKNLLTSPRKLRI